VTLVEKKFLTVKEFAERLEAVGIRVSEQTIRTWIRDGKLQGHRPGFRQWYVLESEVQRLIETGLEGENSTEENSLALPLHAKAA
jgi:excisionase family DNA binding protein